MMDLRQLRYFVKVVDHGNVTRASEALHIAQPAVSQQLRNLEQALGMQLLERSVRGVVPTAAGRTLYRHASELLRLADGTHNLLQQDAEFPSGKVSVGMPSSTARVLAIPLVRTMRERCPGVVLELIEAPSADLVGMVSAGRVQLAVVADLAPTRGVASRHLQTEALYLFVWPGFVLPRQPVKIAELARMPLVLPSAPNTIRSRVEQALREAGLWSDVLFEASSAALQFAAVMARLGVTILPWSAAHVELKERKLEIARVGHPLFARELALCWPETPLTSNAVDKVRATIIELFEELGAHTGWSVRRSDTARRPSKRAASSSVKARV
jgi:LysR family nitrogen assimilation transcriptional regulator